jgi:hypothetical protein
MASVAGTSSAYRALVVAAAGTADRNGESETAASPPFLDLRGALIGRAFGKWIELESQYVLVLYNVRGTYRVRTQGRLLY